MAPARRAATRRRWRGGGCWRTPGGHRAAAPEALGGCCLQKGSWGPLPSAGNTEGPGGFLLRVPEVAGFPLPALRLPMPRLLNLTSVCRAQKPELGKGRTFLSPARTSRSRTPRPRATFLPEVCCPLCPRETTAPLHSWGGDGFHRPLICQPPPAHSFHPTPTEKHKGGWKERSLGSFQPPYAAQVTPLRPCGEGHCPRIPTSGPAAP